MQRDWALKGLYKIYDMKMKTNQNATESSLQNSLIA